MINKDERFSKQIQYIKDQLDSENPDQESISDINEEDNDIDDIEDEEEFGEQDQEQDDLIDPNESGEVGENLLKYYIL